MLKKLFFFFSFIFLFNNFSQAEIAPYCNNKISENLLKNFDNTKIEVIEISLSNYRKWQKNNIKIITENSRVIPLKYKKRFKATVDVTFTNKIKCSFQARIRQHGDFKDHIYLKDGHVVQSLDINLKTGHIYGITKFKLFLPNARGQLADEIILTELLRELNFLAPRTSYVDVKNNGQKIKMLFQEKATKELLEHNLRREGPIIEGDERHMFPMIEKFPNNDLSNMDIGILPEIEKSVRGQLAKITNTNWTSKSNSHRKISHHSLSLINRAFLLYSNQFKNSKNNFIYFNYNLDNDLLALNNSDNILKLDIYNSIIYAANGWHGLVPHNRKFYWNSLKNYFEPIYYDGNFNINEDPFIISLPYSDHLISAISEAEKKIKKIQIDNFFKKLSYTGLNISKNELGRKLEKLGENLKKLNIKINKLDEKLIQYNKNNKISREMWNNYIISNLKINPKVNLIFKNPNNNFFRACKNYPPQCSSINLSNNEVNDLLEGKLTLNDVPYQYIGEYLSENDLNMTREKKYKRIKFKETFFYFDKNIKFTFDESVKNFNIYQKELDARAFFYGGSLSDVNISFFGTKSYLNDEVKNYPFDQRGLTGCLSLIDLNISSVTINSSDSNCEDSINLINVKGSINKIETMNSYRDGLDVDFSNVQIKNININGAGNDCMDLSGGNYELVEVILSECNDKGLSVGEKSSVTLEKIQVSKSNIGLSAKDSSIVSINNADFEETEMCLEAKRKKQEFSGGIINLKNFNCNNSPIYKQPGSFINYN